MYKQEQNTIYVYILFFRNEKKERYLSSRTIRLSFCKKTHTYAGIYKKKTQTANSIGKKQIYNGNDDDTFEHFNIREKTKVK